MIILLFLGYQETQLQNLSLPLTWITLSKLPQNIQHIFMSLFVVFKHVEAKNFLTIYQFEHFQNLLIFF